MNRLTLLVCLFHIAYGLEAYDCHDQTPINRLTLPQPEQCQKQSTDLIDLPLPQVSLVQLPLFVRVNGLKFSKITLDRTYYCSMTRLMTPVVDYYGLMGFSGAQTSLQDLGLESISPPLLYDEAKRVSLSPEWTFTVDDQLIDQEGYCSQRSTRFNLHVQGLSMTPVVLNLHSSDNGIVDHVKFWDETITGPLSLGYGHSIDGDLFIWDAQNTTYCGLELLYSGVPSGYYSVNNESVMVFDDFSTGFRVTNYTHICGIPARLTSIPYLFVLTQEAASSLSLPSSFEVRPSISSLSMANSISISLVASLRGVRKILVEQICKIDTRLSSLILGDSSISPDLAAYLLTTKKGYSVVRHGGEILLTKCNLTSVVIRPTNTCYSMVPVNHVESNTSSFWNPLTSVLSSTAEPLHCSSPYIPSFEYRGTWYRLTPHLSVIPAPMEYNLGARRTLEIPSGVIHPSHGMSLYHFQDQQRLATLARTDPLAELPQDHNIPVVHRPHLRPLYKSYKEVMSRMEGHSLHFQYGFSLVTGVLIWLVMITIIVLFLAWKVRIVLLRENAFAPAVHVTLGDLN
ncbi:putative glycoprotein [Beihai rhabdo-like virus 2]|uniref:Putative glycoprotein n=1 Tax=Beihai rhabdo-like virus 2 TaxID=1922652 RepID=A0A1L3KMM5_9MONO|nr:putative glycoprotein [Beihai rhabdo-like virus 2]APG78671.1 putative glycoprotein [Beihai rhabdo-like virus 2]